MPPILLTSLVHRLIFKKAPQAPYPGGITKLHTILKLMPRGPTRTAPDFLSGRYTLRFNNARQKASWINGSTARARAFARAPKYYRYPNRAYPVIITLNS